MSDTHIYAAKQPMAQINRGRKNNINIFNKTPMMCTCINRLTYTQHEISNTIK